MGGEKLIKTLPEFKITGVNLLFVIFALMLAFLIQKIRYKLICGWADYYKLQIISISAVDLGSKIPNANKWYNQGYILKVKDHNNQYGEVVAWYIYQQMVEPYTQWLSNPLKTESGDNIPNYLPE